MPTDAPLEDADDMLSALRRRADGLRDLYIDDPEGLAIRLGLKLPEKPVRKMLRLGVISEATAIERFGEDTPGLRDLVLDVCSGEVESAVAVGPRGGGKAVALSTPIPTPEGWTTMGDVLPGDQVMGDDGLPTTVVWKSEVLREDTYELVFSDGSTIVAGTNHEWLTTDANTRRRESDRNRRPAQGVRGAARNALPVGPSLRTTEQIAATLADPAEKRKFSPNHSIDNCQALELPEADLPIDPWVLGVWLGDGSSQGGYISTGHEDAEDMQRLLLNLGYPTKHNPEKMLLKCPRLHEELRRTGLVGNKRIPESYMRASAGQRLALLQGLMDTDGTTRSTNNNCQFAQKDDDLVMQFAELIASMGWKYTISMKKAVAQTGAWYYHLLCSFNPGEQAYRLPRKAARINLAVGQRSRFSKRYIVECNLIEREDLQCIQVNNESHMYLVGESMIPTHNSQGVSYIEFFLWIIKLYDALNLGGSELQADQVYQYVKSYIDTDDYWRTLLKKNPLQSKTETKESAWLRVLTASEKSTRSPHAGGIKRDGRVAGGLLVIDEEAEATRDVVESALPTINTARPSVSVRCSTFHNAEGTFAEVVDNAEEMGYILYRWTIFDVAERCDCTDGCEHSEKCFREDHYEDFLNPDTGELERSIVHRAYCGGRSMYADGWVPQAEITKLWKRMKRNHERWEVEQMGSRPSSKGFVIRDRNKFDASFKPTNPSLYRRGAPISITVDWGTVAAGIEVWQRQFRPEGERHVLLHAEQVEEAGISQILGVVLSFWQRYPEAEEVAADIGGGGNYLNPKLREEHGVNVRDVNFAEEKEVAVAAWNIMSEAGMVEYAEDADVFKDQVHNWKRKNGRIQKGNDHMCDAAICYFAKFMDELGLSKIRVVPKSFSTGGTPVAIGGSDNRRAASGGSDRPRVPIVMGIGGRR